MGREDLGLLLSEDCVERRVVKMSLRFHKGRAAFPCRSVGARVDLRGPAQQGNRVLVASVRVLHLLFQ